MSDFRSLKDLLLESAEDLDCVVKQIIESLLNRDKNQTLRGGETVTNLVKLFSSKQEDMKRLLSRVPEFQAREKLIRDLKECVSERDKVIQNVELNLKVAETALTTAVYQANQKLKTVREAEARPINSEDLVHLAQQISKSYSVAAPLFWQQGDPSRPFPTEPEFRASQLMSPKTQAVAIPQPLGMLRQQSNQSIRTPPAAGPRSGGSPMISQQMAAQQSSTQKGWSPRTGYTNSSPRVRGPSGIQVTGRQSSDGTSPYMSKKSVTESPLVSPSLNVNITGTTTSRPAPPPVRNVEQMSSDSSSDSSSDDESPK